MFYCVLLYVLALFFGLVLGFTFRGTFCLIIGIALSAFSLLVWKDIVFANVLACLSTALSTYFFMAKERGL
jgi:hypothetical protein